MRTVLTSDPSRAARELIRGRVAAFPTETVYGLGANVFDEDALKEIFQSKGRPTDNPLILHLHDLAQVSDVVRRVTPSAE